MAGEDADVAAALAAVDATLDALAARDDTRDKFKAYSDLAKGLGDREETASAGRHETAARIRDKNKLALQPLADELGISKTRAHQLVNKDHRKKE